MTDDPLRSERCVWLPKRSEDAAGEEGRLRARAVASGRLDGLEPTEAAKAVFDLTAREFGLPARHPRRFGLEARHYR